MVQIAQRSAQMSVHTTANALKELVFALRAFKVSIVPYWVAVVVMAIARMTQQNASVMQDGLERIAPSD